MKSYSELLEQLERLRKEIDIAREHEARRIAQRVLELLEESGVDVRQLSTRSAQELRRGVRPKPKYWNPDTGATWSGRGRRPRWLVGDNLDRFLIRLPDDRVDSKS
ncbi:H-NS histone [Burkholderia territorii]|uniref:H-NS histone family protein n=1 Tax=Burkholderia cepacia complex TaxID=87882 RepID=UPI0007576560|nr:MULTISPECIES: H-NS histone family protein [Burkholderia cepacia complex]AOI67572.1 H-NS histone [Burkholderia territorii]KWB12333.1 H-NS histone [Burkholderia cepacia]TXG05977.1 H-NS histone family protein [Burkholderia territorii]HDR8861565.1 H-NS histone family protein [Burkholderia territorii]HDR8867668.1 H-NS histone family protein [Burkholderia territorii]